MLGAAKAIMIMVVPIIRTPAVVLVKKSCSNSGGGAGSTSRIGGSNTSSCGGSNDHCGGSTSIACA